MKERFVTMEVLNLALKEICSGNRKNRVSKTMFSFVIKMFFQIKKFKPVTLTVYGS